MTKIRNQVNAIYREGERIKAMVNAIQRDVEERYTIGGYTETQMKELFERLSKINERLVNIHRRKFG